MERGMPNISRILVPVDFSDHSRAAIRYALKFARAFDAELDILHVWTRPRYAAPDAMAQMPATDRHRLTGAVEVATETELTTFLAEFDLSDVTYDTMLKRGSPFNTIKDTAEAGKYDLLVLGTKGRTGLSHYLLGSVAEKVVRGAPCPVLTVHQGDGKLEPPRDE